MAGKLFVHYPPCAGKTFRDTWDTAIRKHPTLSAYASRADIMGEEHCKALIANVERAERSAWVGFYPAYVLVFLVARNSLPPSPFALSRRKNFFADRARVNYHTTITRECTEGIFVLGHSRRWAFDMWRNARRMLKEGKPVWVLYEHTLGRWEISSVNLKALPRAVRMDRRETLLHIGDYVDTTNAHGLFALFQKD